MRAKAIELMNTYSPHIQEQHKAAWGRCESLVLSLVPKGAKQFEAHHAVEHARELYLAEFNKGLPSDLCQRAVFRAYGR